MRRIVMGILSTLSTLVLLFSYHTSTGAGASGPRTVASTPHIVRAPSGTASAPRGHATRAAPTTQVTVVDGGTSQTRWGPVQVEVTLSGGRITGVTALQQPDGNRRDVEINSRAILELRAQALAAQSAGIDGVSGATVTSGGYRESLQSALDAAHFG